MHTIDNKIEVFLCLVLIVTVVVWLLKETLP